MKSLDKLRLLMIIVIHKLVALCAGHHCRQPLKTQPRTRPSTATCPLGMHGWGFVSCAVNGRRHTAPPACAAGRI